MNLADELRGVVGVRQILKRGFVRRRLFCADDAAQVEREIKLQKKRAYQQAWARANPEKIKAMRERDRAKRAAAIKQYKSEWRTKNIVHVRAYQARKMRDWRRAHPERARDTKARWIAKNRAQVNARRRELYAERKAERMKAAA